MICKRSGVHQNLTETPVPALKICQGRDASTEEHPELCQEASIRAVYIATGAYNELRHGLRLTNTNCKSDTRLQALEQTPMCCNSRCAYVRGSMVLFLAFKTLHLRSSVF